MGTAFSSSCEAGNQYRNGFRLIAQQQQVPKKESNGKVNSLYFAVIGVAPLWMPA
jgi:hypothetical protein